MSKPPSSIPDSELDVLKVLWERGQATVRDVFDTLKASGHTGEKKGQPWSYATIATLLDRLEMKKVVESDRAEQAFVYRPIVSSAEVQQRRVDNLVEKLYQGEPGLLVLHLLKSHSLDPDHARAVRDILDGMDRDEANRSGE